MMLSEVEQRFARSVGFLTGLCIVFYAFRTFIAQSFRYGFIFENLALAWLGLIFGWLLVRGLQKRAWLSWQSLLLTVLWLIFLPNTWYVLTDFLHVLPTGEVSELYDIVFISILVTVGFVLGFTSLFLVHRELLKRLSEYRSTIIVIVVILLASFAIYLGRDLRWNSWDVVANPSGVILNVSDQVIDPFGHRQAFNVTGLFFVLLTSIYFCIFTFLPDSVKRAKSMYHRSNATDS